MTLTEVLVVLVIMVLMVALLVPSLTSFFGLEQRQAARQLALLYSQLHDEAVMRNVTFRVAYDLRGGTYQVQVSEGNVRVFDNSDARECFEEAESRRITGLDEQALASYRASQASFASLEARYQSAFELPRGTVFGGIYTPQYGELVRPEDVDDDPPQILFSYVFANGQAEHTVIHLVSDSDPEDGYTIEIEPLSGTVRLHGELIDWRDSYNFVPSQGPDLPSL